MGTSVEMIECRECGFKGHILLPHLKDAHGMTPQDYQEKHPGAEVLSPMAKERLKKISDDGRNERVTYDVAKVFGVSSLRGRKATGWKRPWPDSPVIDPDYVFDPKYLLSILYVLANPGEMMLLIGPTGSGKTSCPTQAVARLNLPYYKMGFDGEIGRSEFVGQWIVTGPDKMEFLYGVLPRAMKEGRVLILDEWDMMRGDVAGVLQSVLEGGCLTILETGEVITPHPDFRVIATANTTGGGDETGLYAGTNVQNYAQRDRWTLTLEVDYLPRATEERIVLKKSGIGEFAKEQGVEAKELMNKLFESCRLIREAYVKGECLCTMSTRTLVNVARKLVAFGDVKDAWNMAYVNKLSSDDKKFVREILQRAWGVKF